MIVAFAWIAPVILIVLWPRAPLAAIGVLMLSHALLLIPTLMPNVQWLGPVVTSFAPEGNDVWLTIDDGPTDDTPAVLDLLERLGARATFFVKGTLARQRPELVRMMLDRGHSVANHSDTHPSGSFWCLPPSRIGQEIDGCNGALAAIAGAQPLWFRAPVGMKNPFVHPHLRRRGMRLIGWSVRGFDGVGEDVERVVQQIVPRVRAGSIVVLHQGRPMSLRCIEGVVGAIAARGYRFVIPADASLRCGALRNTKR